MFKKMRYRILLLNMAMASAVVIVAFALIFATSYTRVQNDNREKLLSDVISIATASGTTAKLDVYHVEPAELQTDEFFVSGFAKRISPDAGLSFSLMVDSEGNVIETSSMFDLPEREYTRAAAEAISTKGSRIVFAGRTWQYALSPISVLFTDVYGSSIIVSGEYQTIRFLDITDSNKMLNSLALTLAGLSVVILAAFFFISRYFANRAVRPMEEAWEKQSRFIADASHELKTPLAVIGANCGVLYANTEETVGSQKSWVDSIMRASDRMTGLIVSLLDLARMEDRETELERLPLGLSELAESAVNDVVPAAEKKGVKMETSIESDISMESDREHVLQILSILLDNAVKYTDCGGTVSVSLKKEKRNVVCEVRNTGGGISEKDLPRLFDRFYRADPARSSENGGYGLGLSIAKTIAQRLGAELSADSKPGEYTAFSLLFKARP